MTRDSTLEFVTALQGSGRVVKPSGDGAWVAQCSGHPDGRPSLAIRRGRGQVLAFCFAGCTADDIANGIGWKVADLFDEPRGVDYEYRHQGQLVRTVHRSPTKAFVQSIVDKAVVPLYQPAGVDIAQTIESGGDVWIPEGEKDADTLASIGFTAVSSPMGASAWAKADYRPLRGRSDLYILADNDEAGIARARGLAALLSEYTTGAVQVMKAKVGKDVTDHIVAGLTINDLLPVDLAPLDVEFEAEVDSQVRYLRVREHAKKRWDEEQSGATSDTLSPKTLGEILSMRVTYDWLIPDLLERRDRVIVTGFEGLGKSYFLRQLAIAAAAGVNPFEVTKRFRPCRVLVIDAENTEEQWARGAAYTTQFLEKRGDGQPRESVVVSAGVRLDLNRRADINQVHRLIDKHRPDVLYIGPLYKLVGRAITNDDDAAPLIVALDSFRERGITLLMEAHAGHGKGSMGERDLRPRGSSALLGWPEFGIGLAPVEGDSDWVNLRHWRGARGGERSWPKIIRHGFDNELPWVRVDEQWDGERA